MTQTIREKARIRQNREQDRSTEDDIARARLGRSRGQVVELISPLVVGRGSEHGPFNDEVYRDAWKDCTRLIQDSAGETAPLCQRRKGRCEDQKSDEACCLEALTKNVTEHEEERV